MEYLIPLINVHPLRCDCAQFNKPMRTLSSQTENDEMTETGSKLNEDVYYLICCHYLYLTSKFWTSFLFGFIIRYTATSINVVGSKNKTTRQNRKVI